MDISPQVQDKLAQFQTLHQQLQLTALQKQQLIAQGGDVDNALAEISKVTGKEKIYRSVGALLIESSKADSEKVLKEEKELGETRMKVMERQEKKLSERYEELKKELQALIGQQQAGSK